MGVRVYLADGEPIGLALRRFKKLVERHGLIWERRKHAYFTSDAQVRRAKRFRKRFKARQATLLAQMAGEQPAASLGQAKAELWRRTGKP